MDPAQSASPSPPAPKKRLPLILSATLVLLGGAGAVAFLSRGAESAAGAPGEPGTDAAELGPPGEPGVLALEPFVLNLADPEGDRYLRLTLRVVLDRAEVAVEAAGDLLEESRLRDLVLNVLCVKSAHEITSFEGKEALRAELRRALAPRFSKARVLDVYFTEFLIQ